MRLRSAVTAAVTSACSRSGTSSTLDDVEPQGQRIGFEGLPDQVFEWRMTVFDRAMGNCQAYFSF